MKLFLRGLFALSAATAFASAAFSDGPAPPVAPKNKGPAAATTDASGAPCAVEGQTNISGRTIGGHSIGRGRFGNGKLSSRLDAGSNRIDQAMERGEERQQRFNDFLKRLAGPPVDVAAASHNTHHEPRPQTQPGTVVFPQHPFARSPRDFFMQD